MDLVQELREIATDKAARTLPFGTKIAADMIEGKAADEIERLRAALAPFAEMLCGNDREGGWEPNYYDEQPDDFVVRSVGTLGRDYAYITVGHLRAARRLLSQSEK